MSNNNRLTVDAFGATFQNPIILAAGTAAFGREVSGVIRLDNLGGFVTKAVSVEPRVGNSAPRLSEFPGGMINAVGLANPGLDAVIADELPWIANNITRAKAFVNVVGYCVEDFTTIVSRIDNCQSSASISGFELNVSCPNVKAGGLEFGADPVALANLVKAVREVTRKPLLVKLSPTLIATIGDTGKLAVDSGADGISVINTMPGLLIDTDQRIPRIGFGSGGMSGKGLLPVGVLATWRVSRAVQVPVLGLGGVESADEALQYIMAGASLVGIGTAAMRNPRVPEKVVEELSRWMSKHSINSLSSIVGSLEWPS